MQKATAYLLTALILLNLFGGYTAFILEQGAIKTEMQLSTMQTQTANLREILSFSKSAFSQLAFTDNGKELQLDGKLYDVVSISHNGDKVYVTLEYDSKETRLIEGFSGSFGQQQEKEQNSSPLKNILSHFQQDYVAANTPVLNSGNTTLQGYNILNRMFPCSSFVANTLAPPPQFFIA